MIELYEPYCMADPVYFELPEFLDDSDSRYGIGLRPTPDGWTRTERQTWLVLRPDGEPMPSQGWKVHVSVRLAEADQALAAVWDHCLAHRIAFKFLRSEAALRTANFKYASRSSSGKLAALYPRDEAQLKEILDGLGAALDGYAGPYILTDLRWRRGPLYLRYGSFVERFCPGPDGQLVLALEGPDGRLVPDERRPVFHVPAWVDVPDFIAQELAARQVETGAHPMPYDVKAALHFSNGGGVYLAADRSNGTQVVLKEARPHAGLDRLGTDAVTRLAHEYDMLCRLDGLDIAPRALGQFSCWEHQFQVQEHIEGVSLQQERARRHPLSFPDPSGADIAAYTEWALDVLRRVESALAAVHERGISYGDLHPSNVVLRPNGDITLLDFEQARPLDDQRPAGLGVPGFSSPIVAPGVPADRFALGCLRLSMFLPLTGLLLADPAKLDLLLDFVTRRFPVPAGFAAQVRAEVAPGLPAARPARTDTARAWRDLDCDSLRDLIAEGIIAGATPHRADRLYPGDPKQFRFGGHTLAYGAAGVLFALSATGAAYPPEHVDWLIDATKRFAQPRTGLFDGLHGVAYVLDRLGRHEEALSVLDRCSTCAQSAGHSLFSGHAGAGLARLYFAAAHANPALLELAVDSAARVLEAVDQPQGNGRWPAGLMHGWSGAALFLIRMYEHTGDPALLDGAVTAIERDLAECQTAAGGAVHLSDGVRIQPFLADGSAGVGLALDAVRAHRDSERYASIADGIDRACGAELVWEPGLFHGRAGMLAYRAIRRPSCDRSVLAGSARLLSWHAQPHLGHTVFPGRMLLRLSADLATGAAGVLLALYGVLNDNGLSLPIPGQQSALVSTSSRGR